MQVDISILIGLAGAVFGIVMGFLAWRRNANKDIQSNATDSGELRSDIGYIKRGIEDIRVDMRVRDKEMGVLTERVAKVEEKAASAHRRIDELK